MWSIVRCRKSAKATRNINTSSTILIHPLGLNHFLGKGYSGKRSSRSEKATSSGWPFGRSRDIWLGCPGLLTHKKKFSKSHWASLDSENSRVHDDIADIALSLPPALAAKLVPQLSRYTESPIKLLLAEKIADLIAHLARGGQGKAALQLAAAALALAPDPRSGGDDDSHRRLAEPQPRFRDWYYARIIHKALPALIEVEGLGTVRPILRSPRRCGSSLVQGGGEGRRGLFLHQTASNRAGGRPR